MSEWLGSIGGWLGDAGKFASSNSNWLAPAAMAGASLYSANANRGAAQTQANALRDAQGTQLTASREALAAQREAEQRALAMQGPWREAGQQALGEIMPQISGGFQATPGYQWTQDEAMRGVQNSASARGMLGSGATMKALQDRSAQLANQEYGNYFNRLQSVAGLGQNATSQGAGMVSSTGNNMAQMQMHTGQQVGALQGQVGNAMANGQTAAGNSLLSGANSLLGYYGRRGSTDQPSPWGPAGGGQFYERAPSGYRDSGNQTGDRG